MGNRARRPTAPLRLTLVRHRRGRRRAATWQDLWRRLPEPEPEPKPEPKQNEEDPT